MCFVNVYWSYVYFEVTCQTSVQCSKDAHWTFVCSMDACWTCVCLKDDWWTYMSFEDVCRMNYVL